MIVDCNAFLGNWAFRRLRHNDVSGLLAMMDRFHIDRACVASADAVLYRDAHAGNEKLREETADFLDRFWCYATLNPAYAGWERDLAACVAWGFKALRLCPCYHDYALDGPEAARIIDAAAEAGLPISLPVRIEDIRQRHWMDVEQNLQLEEVLKVAEAHPRANFLITEGVISAPHGDDLWKRLRDLPIYVEISRMTSVMENSIGALVSELGSGRVLFGTGFPLKTPSPAFLKMDLLDVDPTSKQRIFSDNALYLFQA